MLELFLSHPSNLGFTVFNGLRDRPTFDQSSRLAKPQWGTADAEIKNPPGGRQGLSKVPSF